jgi:Stage II sporulation protein E (SpoIIE)
MKKSALLVLLLIVCACGGLRAQGTSPNAVPVTLGQSVVALNGPWKFHVGDNPRWSDPEFDDTAWETMDLRPTPQTAVPGISLAGFVTGWQARGHPGYAGFAWYRLRVRISGASGPLTLLGPAWFEGGYQIFANGRLIGSFGDFTRQPPELYYPNPASFTVPASDFEQSPNGTVLIAFRFYTPAEALVSPVMGGMHVPPRIGLPSAASAVFHVEWETEYRRLSSALATALVYFFFALLIAMIFAFSRADKILLWPLAACIFNMIFTGLVFSTNAQWLTYVRLQALIDFASVLGWYMWMLAWWAYFGLQRKRWLFTTIVAVGILDLLQTEFFDLAQLLERPLHGLMVAKSVGAFAEGVILLPITAAIAFLGWRGPAKSRWPLYLALFFFALPDFAPIMSLLHMRTNWLFLGVQFPFALLCVIGMLFFFSIVLFQQFRGSLKWQQAMEDDVKQAQEIQQLLIPEQWPKLAGWNIESEYRPAREVGGDFFQIIPNKGDASLLIVAGDVTGKGLQAGMLVAMLVGTIRTESAHTADPVKILNALNARLHGREHAQATCLALHIDADGAATLANAGHLPPYLNGEPLAMEGALPLGMIEGAVPSVMQFQLDQNDRLMLMSDGIAEATDANGKLFGFERIHELLRRDRSAVEIADAAQAFGQEDDISVIAITRAATLESVTA